MRKIVLVVGALILVAGCGREPATPKFYPGDMVVFKINGQKGMILVAYCKRRVRCLYDVRVSGGVKTDTKILSSDGPVKINIPVRIRWVKEFELEPAQ